MPADTGAIGYLLKAQQGSGAPERDEISVPYVIRFRPTAPIKLRVRGNVKVVDIAAAPIVMAMHRAAMSCICRSGPVSRKAFGAYRKAWLLVGSRQTGTTYFGAKFDADIRDRVPQSAFFFGVWEPNISHQLERRLAPGSLFVDVGSNFGYYSLLAAKLVGATGNVVAIEASPSIFRRLCSNIERNGLTNVRCVNAAVSDRRGELTIYAGPSFNTGATSTIEAWRGGPAEAVVQALPINEILTDAERARVRLIKIDVEGAELPILEQILATAYCYPWDAEIIVEFSPSGAADDWTRVFDQFLSAGFAAFGIDNDYEETAYLRWRAPCELQRLTAPPAMKTDILFTRNSQQGADAH